MTRSSNNQSRGAGTGAGIGTSAARDEAAVLSVSAHLTDRDRELIRLVGRHRVLTTGQLAALRFSNLTTARHRLSRVGAARACCAGSGLAANSARHRGITCSARSARRCWARKTATRRRWMPQVRADRQLALERSQRLGHMTGASWFFVALARHAREDGGELAEWLNEAETVPSFDDASAWADIRSRFPNPDGAGTWAQGRPSGAVPAGVRHRQREPARADRQARRLPGPG